MFVVLVVVTLLCIATAAAVGYLVWFVNNYLKSPTPSQGIDHKVLEALEAAAELKAIVAEDLIHTLAEQRTEFKRVVQLMDQLSGRVDKVGATATRTEDATGVAADDRASVAANLAEASLVLESVAADLRKRTEALTARTEQLDRRTDKIDVTAAELATKKKAPRKRA